MGEDPSQELATGERVAKREAAPAAPYYTGEQWSVEPTQHGEETVPPPEERSSSSREPVSTPGELVRGSQVGRYVVLKPVGQGGMAVVYAAYDPELDRKVALKLLRPDDRGADRSTARSRLLREAQAMARISHPNVCPVFDVGTFGNQVFVAMEFIDGMTLSQWLDERHPWREVLRVMVQAGEGLHAAHEAGLVHRDFKPANVLIDKNGRVHVTDFGLARLVTAPEEQTGVTSLTGEESESTGPKYSWDVTRVGRVAGTPTYMPPEQYLKNVPDMRSDQFSFCMVLYEALYGQRPYQPRQMVRAAKALTRNDPSGAGARIPDPPRDVKVPAWVRRAVVRGLSLRATDRFPSMKDLLEELSQEPRQARRRWAAVGAGVALAGLVAGVGLVQRRGQVCAGSDQLMAEVWNPQVQQKLQQAFTATGKPYAANAAATVTRSLEGYAQAWVRQHTQACLATRVQGVQTEELLSRRVVCLERKRKELRALAQLFVEADDKLVERGQDAASSLPSLDECQDIELLSEQKDLPTAPALRAEVEELGTRFAEVSALYAAGRYKPALDLTQKVEPRVMAVGYPPLLAEGHFWMGLLRYQLGDPDAAAQLMEQAFHDAEAGRVDRMKVRVLGALSFIQAGRQQWELADLWGRVARSVLVRLGNDEQLSVDVLINLANVETTRGRYAEARGYLERVSPLVAKLLPPEHPKRARVKFLLGTVSLYLGEEARAVELFRESLQQTEAAVGPDHPDTARRHLMLAVALTKSGAHEQALKHAEAALAIRKAAFGAKHPLIAESLDSLGTCLLGLSRYGEALEAFRASLALKQEVLGPDREELHYSYDGIGQALVGQGKYAEAIEPLEKALSFTSAQEDGLGESGFALAQALWALGQRDRAVAEAKRARALFDKGSMPKRAGEVADWLKLHERSPAPAHRGRR